MIPAVSGLSDRPIWLLLYLAFVAFVAGLARGFSGFGSAMIFVPLASAAVGPTVAAPVLTILDGIGALPMLPAAWRRSDRAAVFIMGMGALLGVPVGTWILTRVDAVPLRWGVCIVILVLTAGLASGWRFRRTPGGAVIVAAGGISGVLTGVAQIGGPPAIAYWLSGAATTERVRANMVLFLVVTQSSAVVAYGYSGLFNLDVVGMAFVSIPGFLAGVFIGTRMFGLARPETFRWICFGLITLAALLGMPVFS